MPDHPTMPKLAVTFFARFARFEHALKHAGYLLSDRNDGVKADWDAFSREPEIVALFPTLSENKEVAYLIAEPPMKRIQQGNTIGWKKSPTVTNMTALCLAIRRARNNLFHGDKANPNLLRNRHLFNACNAALDAMLEAHQRVRTEYEFGLEMA